MTSSEGGRWSQDGLGPYRAILFRAICSSQIQTPIAPLTTVCLNAAQTVVDIPFQTPTCRLGYLTFSGGRFRAIFFGQFHVSHLRHLPRYDTVFSQVLYGDLAVASKGVYNGVYEARLNHSMYDSTPAAQLME